MVRRDIPQHWMVLLERKGIKSARQLAEKAGMSHGTAVRIIFNDGYQTTEENLQKVSRALGVDMKTVYALVGRSTPVVEEWSPPAESARLTREQRQVIEQLIHVMVNTRGESAPIADLDARRRERQALIEHPEQGSFRLAADRSHGPCEDQR